MSIETIEEGAVEDLVRLSQLYIYENKLIRLPQDFFKTMSRLNLLDLNGCQLNSFPNLTGLPRSGRKVSLRRNQTVNISSLNIWGLSPLGIFF